MAEGRKIGIIIIAIFYFVIAALLIVLGAINLIPSTVYPYTTLGGELWITYLNPMPFLGAIFTMIGNIVLPLEIETIFAIVMFIIGAIVALDAVGLIMKKKWAHTLAIIIGIIAIVAIVGIIILWYLFNSDVKMEFGKY